MAVLGAGNYNLVLAVRSVGMKLSIGGFRVKMNVGVVRDDADRAEILVNVVWETTNW